MIRTLDKQHPNVYKNMSNDMQIPPAFPKIAYS